MGVGGQRPAPAALAPGKTWYPLHRRLSGPQGQSVRVRKISPPPGFDPRTVQPVASRYTDWGIPTHHELRYTPEYHLQHCSSELKSEVKHSIGKLPCQYATVGHWHFERDSDEHWCERSWRESMMSTRALLNCNCKHTARPTSLN